MEPTASPPVKDEEVASVLPSPTSDALPPRPPKRLNTTRMSELSEPDDQPPSAGAGSHASTQYDTPTHQTRPAGTAAFNSMPSAGADPDASALSLGGNSPTMASRGRAGSLPKLGLHIHIPQPTPPAANIERSGSHLSSETVEVDDVPPTTPATALSVLPLHAAVASGDTAAVREWLAARAPPSTLTSDPAAHQTGAGGASTPGWPPRPVSDLLGHGSASCELPAGHALDPGEGPVGSDGSERGERGGGADRGGGSGGPPGWSGRSRSRVCGVRHVGSSDRSSMGPGGSRPSPVDVRNEHGNTALAVAAALKDPVVAAELVVLLMEHGASPLLLSGGWSPLHWAAQEGNAAAAAAMAAWEGGRAVDVLSADAGDTPLMVAAASGRIECCLALLDAGADALVVNVEGVGLLSHVAAKVSRGVRSKVRAATRTALLRAAPQLRVLLLHHDDCAQHVSIKPHQESPERISAIMAFIAKGATIGTLSGDEVLVSSDFAAASAEQLLRCHSEEYVSVITELGEKVANTPVAFTPYYQNFKGMPQAKQKKPEFSDTFFSPGTMTAALRAAGGVVHAVEKVLSGTNRTAFVCVRPPGHHAGVDGATAGAPSSGFSILNNAMIGALHALEGNNGGVARRVAVVDFDVHHGNGTEEIARAWHARHRKTTPRGGGGGDRKGDLFFASIHLADDGSSSGIDFYPGTGVADDLHNNIVNVAVPPMWTGMSGAKNIRASPVGTRARVSVKRNRDDELDGSGAALGAAAKAAAEAAAARPSGGREEWMRHLRERVLPPLRAFKPDLLIISAGFDAANHDVGNQGHDRRGQRLAGINLQPDDYEEMTAHLCGIAASSGARVVSVLEGGYGYLSGANGAAGLVREGLAACVVGHVRALAGLVSPPNAAAKP